MNKFSMGVENYKFAWIKQKTCNRSIWKQTVAFLLKWQMLILSLCFESKVQTKLLHRLKEPIWAAWEVFKAEHSSRCIGQALAYVFAHKMWLKVVGF